MTAYFQFEQFHRTWAFSTTFSSENPPHGRSIRISPPYAHILLMNSFSTCKNGRNPLHLADYAHLVGFYDSISGFTPKSIISSKCISHPKNYQYSPNVSAIPETINNSSEMHQYFPSTRSHPSCSLHTQTPAVQPRVRILR